MKRYTSRDRSLFCAGLAAVVLVAASTSVFAQGTATQSADCNRPFDDPITVIKVPLGLFLSAMAAYALAKIRLRISKALLLLVVFGTMIPFQVMLAPLFTLVNSFGLIDTYPGVILPYIAFGVPYQVFILHGFFKSIPKELSEAALIDGYTRFQAFYKVVLPQAATGIASTAIFCLIFAWNEYAFAVLLTSGTAQTAPPFIPTIIGVGGQDWPAVAAGATLFLIPVMVFTVLLRKHLLRGITFGAVRK